MLFITPLRSKSGGASLVLTSWSNSDVEIVFSPHILKQFWCWGWYAVPLGQLCSDITVFVCVMLLIPPLRSNCGRVTFVLASWSNFDVGIVFFPSYLEAILMLGVFCCAPGPVVCSGNHCLLWLSYYSSSHWEASLGGFPFTLTSWSKSEVGIVFSSHL